MAEVERLCDRIIMLKKGQIVGDASPAEFLERFGRDLLEDVFLDVARERRQAGLLKLGNESRLMSVLPAFSPDIFLAPARRRHGPALFSICCARPGRASSTSSIGPPSR